ncbi:MAG TPA: cobalamin biosynthesis protein [Clostridia bacterium]|nr:cobalamin biosynthesis protein [Clostridia bacterium]
MTRNLPMNTERATRKTAILALTEQGSRLSLIVAGKLKGKRITDVYLPQRFEGWVADCPQLKDIKFFRNWRKLFAFVFGNYDELICVMATGIVVRSAAGHLRNKFDDPAVVVLDEEGKYAISLLSGHIGGANDLARYVAAKLCGQAVITTATDVNRKPAVDLLAAKLDAVIRPIDRLKIFNRALAEGKELMVTSPFPIKNGVIKGFKWLEWSDLSYFGDYLVVIGPVRLGPNYTKGDGNAGVIQLLPKNLVVGVGCRKGVSPVDVSKAYGCVLEQFQIPPICVKSLATIDFKKEEKALRLLSEKLKIPLKTVSRREIAGLEGTYESSRWVQKKIGVGGVCEPAARLVAKMGTTIVPKQKVGPVTISVAMEKSWWLD